MIPVVKQLRAPLEDAPYVDLNPPVVRIQARFGNTWAAWGSGFFIDQWPSSIITARHVVALPQGVMPNDVRVEAFVNGNWSTLDVFAISFPSGGPSAPDVAIVRIQGMCHSTLRSATLDSASRVEIWGYPLTTGRPAPAPIVVDCRAQPMADRIDLARPGSPGMSGGPVVAISDTGIPLAAVGIYLGTSPRGARARILLDDALLASKDAALQIMSSKLGQS